MTALEEAKSAPEIAAFVRTFNNRISPEIAVGQTWVRFTPPVQADFDSLKTDPRFLPFTRVGALGVVTETLAKFVTFRIGGDSVMFDTEVFREVFVRAVPESQWKTQD
jgi:hypothetical protein